MIDATKLTPPLNSVDYFFSPISETPPMDWVTPGSCSSVESADQSSDRAPKRRFPEARGSRTRGPAAWSDMSRDPAGQCRVSGRK